MCYLKSFCGCLTLRNGTYISGLSGTLAIMIFLIIDMFQFVQVEEWINDPDNKVLIDCAIISAIIKILFDYLLIKGAIKQKPTLILSWLIVNGFGFVIITVVIVIKVFTNAILIVGLVGLVLFWYSWVVVLSYYHELRTQSPDKTSDDASSACGSCDSYGSCEVPSIGSCSD